MDEAVLSRSFRESPCLPRSGRPRGVEEELLRDAEGRSDAKDGGALFTPGVEANEGIIIIGRRDCETAVQERFEFTQELATIRR